MNRRALLSGLAVLASSPVLAHDWYDRSCCSGRDCSAIPNDAVMMTGDGYLVTLEPGEHPMVTRPFAKTIRAEQIKPSPDGKWHACIGPQQDRLICLYGPMTGA